MRNGLLYESRLRFRHTLHSYFRRLAGSLESPVSARRLNGSRCGTGVCQIMLSIENSTENGGGIFCVREIWLYKGRLHQIGGYVRRSYEYLDFSLVVNGCGSCQLQVKVLLLAQGRKPAERPPRTPLLSIRPYHSNLPTAMHEPNAAAVERARYITSSLAICVSQRTKEQRIGFHLTPNHHQRLRVDDDDDQQCQSSGDPQD